MPYKVIVIGKDGINRVEVTEIHHGPTPHINSEATVSIDDKTIRAFVFGVRTMLSKSSGTAIEAADTVDAKEI